MPGSAQVKIAQAQPLRPLPRCCELPASQASAVQNIKLTVPCRVLLSQWQRDGLLCRFCCQDGLRSRYSIKPMPCPVNSMRGHMQGSTPFHLLQLTEIPALVPQVTDTAMPFTPIPIYFIHSLERPFCPDQSCKCHWQQQQVRKLLGNILAGEITLRQAADFLDDINGERK